MEARLTVLKSFLEVLGVSPNIETVESRKLIQKTVYLGQLSGIKLGYRYGWYLMGPYSTTLTQDYYALADTLAIEEEEPQNRQFNDEIRNKIRQVLPLMTVPSDLVNTFDQSEWVELVASLHFLRVVSQLSSEHSKEILTNQKPKLVPFVAYAERALQSLNLLSNNQQKA
jgi:uncharacterized protein YwgA